MNILKLAGISILCFTFTGCELVDSQILQGLQEYFPQVELSHPRPGMLQVDTHLANLSEKFAQQTVATILSSHCCHGGGLQGLAAGDLDQVLPAAGYTRLIITFEGLGCIYDPPNTQVFRCFVNQGQLHTYNIHEQSTLYVQPLQPLQPLQRIR